jgi:CBS domain-containing protein
VATDLLLVLAHVDGGTGHISKQEETDMGPKVHEHMTERPRCVTPETRVSEAAELMASEDVGSLPILDDDKLTGVVTDRDIVIRAVAANKDPQGMPVREIATHDPVTVHADDDLADALRLMATYQVRRLPVVDEDNRLVGVLAQADVAMGAKEKAVGEMVEEISQTPTGPRV